MARYVYGRWGVHWWCVHGWSVWMGGKGLGSDVMLGEHARPPVCMSDSRGRPCPDQAALTSFSLVGGF